MSNKAKVQAMYEAFGRGDVPALLEHLDENVEWEYGPTTTDLPWLQKRHGREGAGGFFQSLTELDFTRFEVKGLFEEGNIVLAICDVAATVKATGKSFDEPEEVHIWTFNDSGLVQRFRHRVDTHAQWKAYHGG